MFKKKLFLLLMVFSLIGMVSAFGIHVTNCTQLQNMNNDLFTAYYLDNDIDCSDTINWNNGSGFLPIGNSTTRFFGYLFGQNYKISNLYINRSTETGGLIGYNTNSSKIFNVNLEDVNIKGFNYVGALVGYNQGNITNCSSSGFVNATIYDIHQTNYMGGLVGYNNEGNIINSNSSVNIKGDGYHTECGGLIGTNSGYLNGCSASGSVNCIITDNLTESNSISLGGLIGINNGPIINSYSTGNINTNSNDDGYDSWNVGGLIGYNTGGINNSYSKSNVTSLATTFRNHPAGFIGVNSGNIINSYSTGKISGNTFSGGLISSNTGNIINSFWDINTSTQTTSQGGIGKTTTEMKNIKTFIDKSFNLNLTDSWDFLSNLFNDTYYNNIWNINVSINEGYPYLILHNFNVYLNYPDNSSSQNANVSFNCSAISQSNLINSTLQIWNKTSNNLYYSETQNISGLSNETIFNYTFLDEGEFLWNCLYYDVITSTSNSVNYTVYESLIAPATTLNSPSNNIFLDYNNNINFSFTSLDNDNLDICELWGNFTGSWENNYTWSSPLSGNITSVNLDLIDNYYNWNIWCNDTSGNGDYSPINFTVGVDTIFPIFNDNVSITITPNSETFLFKTNITDVNLNLCQYTILDENLSINGINSNITFNCNQLSSATTFGFGNYLLVIDVYDIVNHHIQQNKTFSTTYTPSGGGGDGGASGTTLTSGNWTMETEFGGSSYQFTMIQKTSRSKDLLFENLGTTSRTIKLTCEPVSGGENLCENIQFDKTQFSLPLQRDIKTSIGFKVTIPADYEKGKYIINLVATDEDGNKGIITVTSDITSYKSITGIITKLFSNTNSGFPYFIIFIMIALFTGVLVNFIILKPNKIPSSLSLLVGLFFGVIFLLLPI